MPRAKRKTPAEWEAQYRAADQAQDLVCALLEPNPGDTITFQTPKGVLTGQVGASRWRADGHLEYFVYVPRPDGFGTTSHNVMWWDVLITGEEFSDEVFKAVGATRLASSGEEAGSGAEPENPPRV